MTPSIVILIPVYDDWRACGIVLGRLDAALEAARRRAVVLLVDDGSSRPRDELDIRPALLAIERIDLLVLGRNLGHQRAICIGLCHVEQAYECDAVVVTDSDGEDDPDDVPRLLDRWEAEGRRKIVFAERVRRSEGSLFQLSYALYRAFHRVLTGVRVRVGNFSVIPRRSVASLVVTPELWSHYAATVFVSRLPYTLVPTSRAKRVAGTSTMNFVALVAHGLSAISVFSEVIGVRVLLATIAVAAGMTGGMAAVLGVWLVKSWAVPGWATYTTGLLLVILLLTVMFAFLFTFLVLFARKSAAMLPARDYGFFIDRACTLHPVDGDGACDSGENIRDQI